MADKGNQPIGSMSTLAGALLALIMEAPGHGYNLAARFRHRVGPAFAIEPQAVYPYLNALYAAGLIDRQTASKRGSQVIYLYCANARTVTGYLEWLAAPLSRESSFRELVIKVTFSRPEDMPLLESNIDNFEQLCQDQITNSRRTMVNAGTWDAAMLNASRIAAVFDQRSKIEWAQQLREELRRAYREFVERRPPQQR